MTYMKTSKMRILLFFILLPCTVLAAPLQSSLPTSPVEQRNTPQEYILDGVLEAVNQSTVSAQTSGRVEEILVDVNDTVEAGKTIIRLRASEQQAGLDQAQAALQEAQARYHEAQTEYQRVANIFQRKLIAKAELDAAEAAFNAAAARLDSAVAGVQRAREQVSYTEIKAPYSGIVLERQVELGEAVQPGQPLMTGFSLDLLRAVSNVPQRLLNRVQAQSRAEIILPDDSRVSASKLVFFPYADPASNVFKVRVYLPEKTPHVYPGMFVKVAFTVGEQTVLTIPRKALLQRSELSAVYVLAEGRVSLRQIRPGRVLDDDRLEILAGLDAGEQVVLDPVAARRFMSEQDNAGNTP